MRSSINSPETRRRRPRPRSPEAEPRCAAAVAPSPLPSRSPRELEPDRPRARPEARRRPPPRSTSSLLGARAQSALVPRPSSGGYVVDTPLTPAGEIPAFQTAFFASLRAVRARAVEPGDRALEPRSLAELRGYTPEDLLAVAEIAHHYLFNGGVRIALVLYEGLTAVAPNEPYFALALGLTHDHLDDPDAALHWYQRAGRLDPTEPRADLNQAELFLQLGDVRRAQGLLSRALRKAEARDEQGLIRKARALLRHLDNR